LFSPSYENREFDVKVTGEVSNAELEEMQCDSLNEFEDQLCQQLDNGVVTDNGCIGLDWMCGYELEVVQV
jgi:hypothetical protein